MNEVNKTALDQEFENFLKNSAMTKKKAWRISEDYKNQWYQKESEQIIKILSNGDLEDLIHECCY